MSNRLVAFEWDSNELRVALARSKAKAAVIDEAFSIPFNEKGAAIVAEEIGSLLGKELQQRGIPKGEALVAVGRANLELRFLTAPPAPPEELPDLVRFQAMRQFTTLGDDWPLDFSPLGTTADGSTNVLATTISPEIVNQIRSVCTAAGLTPSHLVLRPFAAAALLRKHHQDERCRMTVELLGEDADLAVTIGPEVVYPRTVRLPGNEAPPEVRNRALIGEIKRTIVAAQNQLGGRRVETIILFGDERKLPEIEASWKNDLQMEVQVLNPFSLVDVSESLQRAPVALPGAFAPLLGLLAEETAGRPHTIDFLHPRRRPPPVNHNRLYMAIGGCVGAVALCLFLLAYWNLWTLSSEALQLQRELLRQTKLVDQGKAVRTRAAELDKFSAADVNWLDELERLSQRFPPADQARVEDLLAQVKQTQGGGSLIVQGVADHADTISEMEAALRDEGHTVQGSGGKHDPRATDLTLRYREEILVHGPDGAPAGGPGGRTTPAVSRMMKGGTK